MSPAVEQNIIKRMKKQNEQILKPKKPAMSRISWRKKEASCGLSTKSDSSKSTVKLSGGLTKKHSSGKNIDVSPRLINRITPSPFEAEPTGIRYIAYPIATTVPFNRTLSTSTPDPEKQPTPKHVNTESVAAAGHSISTQTLTEQWSEKPPPPPPVLSKIKATKLQQIIRNQTKAAQRKSTTNSQFKPHKMNSSGRQMSNKLKSKNDLEVSRSNIPSYIGDQNAVSFSIHQVNKVTSAGQKLITSQNSAFNQVVCNVAQMQPPSFNKDPYVYSHKMADDPCRQQMRNKSPAFPGNTQNISTNVYATQSDTHLLTKPSPDIQTNRLRPIIPNSTASQQFPLEDAVVSCDSTPSSSRYTTTSCPEAKFELYSQDERSSPHTSEQRVPSPQYVVAHTSISNSMVTTINRDGNSLINHFVPPESSHIELHPYPTYTQITSNHAFAPVDHPLRHHESEDLVPFEEPVRDSDTQAKTKNLPEYSPTKSDSLSKIPYSMKVPETAATKRPETSRISDDVNIKTAATDHFSSQNDYIQHPSSNIHNLPPLQWQSVEALAGAKTLRFMINELEEICKSTNHCEINRLVKQIQQVVNSLPQLSDTFDLQTEIGLSLQPLRNENSQLRRRLRLVSEEATQEREKIEADQRRQTLELQLQLLNLEKRVDEEKLSKHQQLQQQEELVKELNLLKMERQSLVKDLGQQETSHFDLRRENWEENRKYLREMEIAKKEVEEKVLALEAAEKKNHILQITLEQRDMEMSRMHEILLSAREGMKELIQNLCQSKDLTTPPSEGIDKFFTFLTQDPTSEGSSNLKIVSTGDSTATLTDSWITTPASSIKGGSTPIVQKTALESSVDKRLQELLDTLKGPCRQQTLVKGNEQPQASSSVNNLPNTQSNFNKTKDYLRLQNQEMNQTSCLPLSDMKDSGCGASPDTENLIPTSNDNHDLLRSNLNAFQVLSVSSAGNVASCSSPQENSADVTRASITDYFAKYPKSKVREQYCADGAESARDQQEMEEEEEAEGGVGADCLNAKQISNKIMQNILNKNKQFFSETVSELDMSSLSQYTVTTLSSLTGDVRTFRQGLASLDENIARLQASIKTSKNTFST